MNDSYKKSPVSSYNKETGLYLHKSLRYHSSCRVDTAPHGDPTIASRCIGRAPSVLLSFLFRTAAQRPVYSSFCSCLAPTDSSLDAGMKLLFPLQSVCCMCGGLYHEKREVSSIETQKSASKIQNMALCIRKKDGSHWLPSICTNYSMTWIQPSGASMRPIWIPVRVS